MIPPGSRAMISSAVTVRPPVARRATWGGAPGVGLLIVTRLSLNGADRAMLARTPQVPSGSPQILPTSIVFDSMPEGGGERSVLTARHGEIATTGESGGVSTAT